MQFNLIDEQWIPVLRRDGSSDRIAPHEVTKGFVDNPVVALDAPRADFNGALIQFLIGLVQTAAAPTTTSAWRKKLTEPPTPDELKAVFTTIRHAFELGGDGPRFMQDFEDVSADFGGIDGLLIESPGEHTKALNIDHFNKRDSVGAMCPHCCAIALFAFQTNSPEGGTGFMTSLRGGGPLTTLVLGDANHATLWQLILLNVLESGKFLAICGNPALTADNARFPWLGETKEGRRKKGENLSGEDTTPEIVHPATMFWAMPRRIKLKLTSLSSGSCDICGRISDSLVSSYKEIPGGASYRGAWLHPLSPYYEKTVKGDTSILPVHAQPGGISYRHWLGLVQQDGGEKKMPARIVNEFYDRWKSDWQFRLWAFGFNMKKMKAVCWYESTMPLLYIDASIKHEYEHLGANIVKTAVLIGENLRIALKNSMHGKPTADPVTGKIKWSYRDIRKLPSDEDKRREKILSETKTSTVLISVESYFWQNTEPQFFVALHGIRKALEDGDSHLQHLREWHDTLCREAQSLFDIYVWNGAIEDSDPKRIVIARMEMVNLNRGDRIIKMLGL